MRYRWIVLLLLLTSVAACTALRIGYRQADTILAWRADGYLDFNPQQKHDFRERLDRVLYWHRYEQLPEYAVFVSTAVKKGQSGLKREDIMWFVEGVKSRYRIIIDHGIDDAVEVLATVTPDQIVTLQKQWDKDNRKFASERELNGTPAERRRSRLERVLKEIADWTGSLRNEQEAQIATLLELVPDINPLRQQDRIRRQTEFLQLLKLRPNKQEFRPRLHAWLRDWESGRSPEFERVSNEVYEKRIQFYMAIEKLLTPEQRQSAWHRLQQFGDDFKSLSEKPAKAGIDTPSPDRLALFCLPALDACLSE
jgi:Family of unknown function (DUF6279)